MPKNLKLKNFEQMYTFLVSLYFLNDLVFISIIVAKLYHRFPLDKIPFACYSMAVFYSFIARKARKA